jgi:hypothetical protein
MSLVDPDHWKLTESNIEALMGDIKRAERNIKNIIRVHRDIARRPIRTHRSATSL